MIKTFSSPWGSLSLPAKWRRWSVTLNFFFILTLISNKDPYILLVGEYIPDIFYYFRVIHQLMNLLGISRFHSIVNSAIEVTKNYEELCFCDCWCNNLVSTKVGVRIDVQNIIILRKNVKVKLPYQVIKKYITWFEMYTILLILNL